MSEQWWQEKTLQQLNHDEWESLCDGCARCCLIKLQDDETDELYLTNVACRYLDLDHCRCTEYQNRQELVPTCVNLNPDNIAAEIYHMPDSCAYKRLWQGKSLPHWHPLMGGKPEDEGIAIGNLAILESEIDEDDLEDHIIEKVDSHV